MTCYMCNKDIGDNDYFRVSYRAGVFKPVCMPCQAASQFLGAVKVTGGQNPTPQSTPSVTTYKYHNWNSSTLTCRDCNADFTDYNAGKVSVYCTPSQKTVSPQPITASEAFDRLNDSLSKIGIVNKPKFLGCSHEYVPYTGLIESFEFCKHCDARKA